MKISKLNKIIRQFHKNENYNDIYSLGLCSEFAVALKRFLGAGEIYKAGLLHTCLKYKDHYCDIRGCYPRTTYRGIVPSVSLEPATNAEIAHIHKLLEKDSTKRILDGLRQAQKEVKK